MKFFRSLLFGATFRLVSLLSPRDERTAREAIRQRTELEARPPLKVTRPSVPLFERPLRLAPKDPAIYGADGEPRGATFPS